jgi:hypothetical protein
MKSKNVKLNALTAVFALVGTIGFLFAKLYVGAAVSAIACLVFAGRHFRSR